MSYISSTSNSSAFEFTTVKLLDCSLQVCSSLELDEASVLLALMVVQLQLFMLCLPFAITVTAGLRVDDVKAGLTSEVFKILYPEVHVSGCPGLLGVTNAKGWMLPLD